MDMITLAMAKAYSDSKGGYSKPGKVLTYDGNKTGKPVIGDIMVKISDNPIDLNAVESITVAGVTVLKENFSVEGEDQGAALFMGGMVVVASYTEDVDVGDGNVATKGVWVAHSDTGYVSKVVLAETIVPIDQKYLPGVCLPVVELTTEPTAEGAVLTAEESAKLDAVATLKLPIIVKCNIGSPIATTAMWNDDANAFMILMGFTAVTIIKDSDTWLFMIEGQ